MTQPSVRAKELFSGLAERLIRVLVTDNKHNGFSSLTFPDTEVSGVMERGEKASALLLRSGVEIPVAIPYEELEQRIYRPNFRTDGSILDLRDVTGEVANDTAEPKIGDKMPDGTVFAGISPYMNQPMYAMPVDAPLTMKFNQAKEYAANLDAHGHRDWRMPTLAELNVLFNNRASIGGFDVTGSYPAGWYWSASPDNSCEAWGQRFSCEAWGQRFSNGAQGARNEENHSAVRCVR